MNAREDCLIELRNVTKTYRRNSSLPALRSQGGGTRALRGISLCIGAGEFLIVRGKSGSGKTTLLNLIGCLDLPTSGGVIIKGTDASLLHERELARFRNATIGYIFQSLHLQRRRTAAENVMAPLVVRGECITSARERAVAALRQVGLEQEVMKRAGELSGGQAQRVAIARALVAAPEVLLADEPTGNLDRETGKEILELLISLRAKEGRTLVLVTHDEFPLCRADRVVTIDAGEIVEIICTGEKGDATDERHCD
jgi:putative ABC transport system ATP-binding protein